MSTIEDIKAEIRSLSKSDYAQLQQWFNDRDWDMQIAADSAAGKLDHLADEALREKKAGKSPGTMNHSFRA